MRMRFSRWAIASVEYLRTSQLDAYLYAVASAICVYLITVIISGRPLMAAVFAIIATLASYFLCRLIRDRGRMSLAMTVFVLPLLTAIVCFAYLRLSPFIQRQEMITNMRNAGVGFLSDTPERHDEWVRSESGSIACCQVGSSTESATTVSAKFTPSKAKLLICRP